MDVSKHIKTMGILLCVVLTLSSCSSDEKIGKKPVGDSIVKKAQEILAGEIVFSSRATMNGEDRTLLKNGCPTKFRFKKHEDGTVTIELLNFRVGNMPFAVGFRCRFRFMELNTWEKGEYKGKGWIKFEGRDGVVDIGPSSHADAQKGSGASINGFLNVDTNQIEFIIDYNMMSVRSETFLQTIDKSRLANYGQEFKQYEADLKKYKEEHGL